MKFNDYSDEQATKDSPDVKKKQAGEPMTEEEVQKLRDLLAGDELTPGKKLMYDCLTGRIGGKPVSPEDFPHDDVDSIEP